MKLGTWDPSDTDEAIALWNREAVRDGYKEWTAESFGELIASNRYFDPSNAFVLRDGNVLRGFAIGCAGDDLPLGDVAGYVTCVVLDEACRSDEHYGMLMDAVEERFRQLGKRQADFLFFNPMMLPWYIPNTPGHEHNNAPGVPVGSALYAFLLSRGYAQRAIECAMYLSLAGFELPAETAAKETKVAEAGYRVEMFEPFKHGGVEGMLDALGNPLWKKEIAESVAAGVPVVVAAHGAEPVGFAGPVVRSPNGRGYFAGLGVRPEHEGHGLGSLLFYKLCEAFRDIGADYMSLYTGSENPALRIYEKAGFRTVKQFAIMRRELA
ncbi:GNAT family N-acetyltransferase [Cohnella zeiphila]|uniref:GNAT family N-acetyltransferase n=1 Tax=Cohnella zeiphila TaxID=2761120 RepID=A0A7X0VUM5_9BACL|nr:GNAT family N-acetyltransferase [Cohnella zeiphila]MBB6730432.1 GNAT family N-acetyltransferase [Cohnella zeiphila]